MALFGFVRLIGMIFFRVGLMPCRLQQQQLLCAFSCSSKPGGSLGGDSSNKGRDLSGISAVASGMLEVATELAHSCQIPLGKAINKVQLDRFMESLGQLPQQAVPPTQKDERPFWRERVSRNSL